MTPFQTDILITLSHDKWKPSINYHQSYCTSGYNIIPRYQIPQWTQCFHEKWGTQKGNTRDTRDRKCIYIAHTEIVFRNELSVSFFYNASSRVTPCQHHGLPGYSLVFRGPAPSLSQQCSIASPLLCPEDQFSHPGKESSWRVPGVQVRVGTSTSAARIVSSQWQ